MESYTCRSYQKFNRQNLVAVRAMMRMLCILLVASSVINGLGSIVDSSVLGFGGNFTETNDTQVDDFQGPSSSPDSSSSLYPFYDSEGSYNYYYNHYYVSRMYYNYVFQYSYNFYGNHPYYGPYGYGYYNSRFYDYYDSSNTVATLLGYLSPSHTANGVALHNKTLLFVSTFYDHVYQYNYEDSVATYQSSVPLPLRPDYSSHDPVIATNGKQMVIGDCDSVLTYVLVNNVWSYSSILKGHVHGTFGDSLGLSQDTLMVGQNIPGNVYIYSWTSSEGSWSLTQTLTGNHGELFGLAIAVDGNRALIGAPRGESVFCYYRNSGGVWSLASTFGPPIYTDGRFGYNLALSGPYAIVGSEFVKELFIYRYSRRHWMYENNIDTGVEALAVYGSELIVCNEHFNVAIYSLSGGNNDDDTDDAEDDEMTMHHDSKTLKAIILGVGLGGGTFLLACILSCAYCYCYRKRGVYKPTIVPTEESDDIRVITVTNGKEVEVTQGAPSPYPV